MAVSRIDLIIWNDAVADSGWKEHKDAAPLLVVRSIGYVVSSDRKAVVLAGSWGFNTETKKMETNNRMTIPKGWIVSRTRVKLWWQQETSPISAMPSTAASSRKSVLATRLFPVITAIIPI